MFPPCFVRSGVAHPLRVARRVIEGGTAATLSDVSTFTSSNIRLPTEVCVATEKMHGLSIAVDVFHGPNHLVAIAIHQAVIEVTPTFHGIVGNASRKAIRAEDQPQNVTS